MARPILYAFRAVKRRRESMDTQDMFTAQLEEVTPKQRCGPSGLTLSGICATTWTQNGRSSMSKAAPCNDSRQVSPVSRGSVSMQRRGRNELLVGQTVRPGGLRGVGLTGQEAGEFSDRAHQWGGENDGRVFLHPEFQQGLQIA